MSKSEYDIFKKILDQKKKEVQNNQAVARAFLVKAGIFTVKGNPKKVYKEICTPKSPV